MEKTSETKIITLILSALFIAQAMWFRMPSGVGLCEGASWSVRLAYPFIHAGVIHALCNAWCLLSIVFYYGCSMGRLVLALVIAVTIPSALLIGAPAVGFSGALYAILGLMSFDVDRKVYWQKYIWVTILLGMLIPHMAVAVHSYCFAVGTLIASINYPFIRRR